MSTVGARREVRPVRALVHAIEVLDALAEQGELGVTELSRQIALSKTAVYNILATFESHRMVHRDPVTSRYRLGWRVYELGTELLRHNRLAPLAEPVVKELARETGETVLLGILDRTAVTYVQRAESERSLRMVAAPGRQAPLHATASGKVLLAHQPTEFIEQILAGELRAYTPKTIVEPDLLRAELVTVLERGYATCVLEHEPEIASISVPVRDYSGGVAAALTLAGPATRFSEPARRAALGVLTEFAGRLGARLGGRHEAGEEVA